MKILANILFSGKSESVKELYFERFKLPNREKEKVGEEKRSKREKRG